MTTYTCRVHGEICRTLTGSLAELRRAPDVMLMSDIPTCGKTLDADGNPYGEHAVMRLAGESVVGDTPLPEIAVLRVNGYCGEILTEAQA